MVARDEQKRMAGRVAWGDMVDGAGADMMAWGDALGVMTWVTATSRRKEGLTGTDGRRKGQAGDHRTANKRGQARERQQAQAAGAGAGRDG